MELKEIIKILKDNLMVVVVFIVFGGVVAGGFVLSGQAQYRGDFVIYLNKSAQSKEVAQNYNDFYALESLGLAADFLVEWTKAEKPEFKLKKKTALYLAGSVMTGNAESAKDEFAKYKDSLMGEIARLNKNIFSAEPILAEFSEIEATEIKINFWRHFIAGIFGGFILGIFTAFLRHYFSNQK